MSTIEEQAEVWPNEAFDAYLQRCLTYQQNLPLSKKRKVAFDILARNYQDYGLYTGSTVLEDLTTWDDLHLFRGSTNRSACLLNNVDRTSTEIGKLTLATLIAQPLTDKDKLEKRQSLIKELVDNKELFQELDKQISQFKQHENMLLSFWTDDQFKQASNREYVNFPYLEDALNNSEIFLLIRKVINYQRGVAGFVSNIAAAAILPVYVWYLVGQLHPPALLKDIAMRLTGAVGALSAFTSFIPAPIGVKESILMSIAMGCALSAQDSLKEAQDAHTLTMYMQEKLMHVASSVKLFKSLFVTLGTNALFRETASYKGLQELMNQIDKENQDLGQLVETLETSTFEQQSSLSNYGRILVAYRLMHSMKASFEKALCAFGELDAYLSIARLYKEYKAQSVPVSFVTYKHGEKEPSIFLENMWNPFISPDKVVTNTVSLGSEEAIRNFIITGPNAGGKSTIIKGIALNLILAQTLGIAAASQAAATPLDLIITSLNIPDDIGSGNSLFKAQILRAEYLLRQADSLTNEQFGFLAFDEMFNGTDPQVGQALSYSVAKKLGTNRNTITVLSTHFPLLTTLEKESNFKNYRVKAIIDASGEVHYPFTLEQGISEQNIALDMIRQEGFSSDIIEEARHLLVTK
jgi:DNA mismatch repair protein MutS